jgi:beta-galactosidase
VKYAPGILEARGYRGGEQVLAEKRETTGPAARILLRSDRSRIDGNGQDVAMVTATVADAQGREVPIADNDLAFEVSGSGKLLGLGNGDPSCHQLDTAGSRRAFNGLCMAIVQASKEAGEIQVKASSPGLESGTVNMTAGPAPPRPAVA